jgi:prepilin-type N-terminal cleavage/methylation domain-containing protein
MSRIGIPGGSKPYNIQMRRAFTLIELLTVMAIISILAAIIFPVFARAKAAAKQSTCISNLRQIGDSIEMYMDDSDDIFPSAVDPSDKYDPSMWAAFPQFEAMIPTMPLLSDAVQPYLKNHEVFHCRLIQACKYWTTIFQTA